MHPSGFFSPPFSLLLLSVTAKACSRRKIRRDEAEKTFNLETATLILCVTDAHALVARQPHSQLLLMLCENEVKKIPRLQVEKWPAALLILIRLFIFLFVVRHGKVKYWPKSDGVECIKIFGFFFFLFTIESDSFAESRVFTA